MRTGDGTMWRIQLKPRARSGLGAALLVAATAALLAGASPAPSVAAGAPVVDGPAQRGTTGRVQSRAPQAVSVPPVEIRRLGGESRIDTAIAVARASHADGADAVVLARADDYADALTGGPLAASLDAPLLLTGPDGLDPDVAEAVRGLGASSAVLLGGTEALGEGVEADVQEAGLRVERVAGPDRFATAAAIAERLGGTDAFLTRGVDADPARGWPDAVAVSAIAAATGRPILLAGEADLPEATLRALDGRAQVQIVGGTAAVPDQVVDDLRERGLAVERTAGADRYATSRALLERHEGVAGGSRPWLVTGRDWPDALSAGPAAAADGGALVLVDGVTEGASSATSHLLRASAGDHHRVTLVGGAAAVRDGFGTQGGGAVPAPQRGEWSSIPQAPIPGRIWHTSTWTGSELVVWGGYAGTDQRRDGAAYDPAAGTWRRIADAPFGGYPDHVEVWTGNEVVVLGTNGNSPPEDPDVGTGAYDPVTDTWRTIPQLPFRLSSGLRAAWTGREVLAWGTVNDREGRFVVFAYDPVADRWREATPAPLDGPRYFPGVVWTGAELVVAGGQRGGVSGDPACPGPTQQCPDFTPDHHRDAAAWDPGTDAWRRLPDLPEQLRNPTRLLGVADGEVLAATEAASEWRLAAWDPDAGTARLLADPPGQAAPWRTIEIGDGGLLAVQRSAFERADAPTTALRYDHSADAWERLAGTTEYPDRDEDLVWTGDRLMTWGGYDERFDAQLEHDFRYRNDGVALDPEAEAPPAPTPDVVVTALAQVTGGPFTATATDPGPVAFGRPAASAITLITAGPAVDLGPIIVGGDPVGPDGGRLTLAGPNCGWSRDDDGGYRSNCSGIGAALFLRDGEPGTITVEVVAAEGQRPSPGEYVIEVPFDWWDAPPGQEYGAPTGTASLRLSFWVSARA